jgi:hypothetical protein
MMSIGSVIFLLLFVIIVVWAIAALQTRFRRPGNDSGHFHAGMGDASYHLHHTEHGQSSSSHDQGGTSGDHGGHWGSHDTGDAGGGGDWGGGDGGGGDGGGGGE